MLVLGPTAQAQQLNANANPQRFASFATLRAHVLNVIGSAKSTIWLATDYLTDGEIVSALYIAKYRKINVAVLLGRRKARAYMSRLHYLKQQKIPVYLKPQGFPRRHPTMLLVDDRLLRISSNLNFLTKRQSFHVDDASEAERLQFEKQFSAALTSGQGVKARPRPLVGRAKHDHKGKPLRGYRHNTPRPRPVVMSPYRGEQDGSYNYNMAPRETRAPKGFPRKLPKRTISEERQLNQRNTNAAGGN